jgi:hypothetical protein
MITYQAFLLEMDERPRAVARMRRSSQGMSQPDGRSSRALFARLGAILEGARRRSHAQAVGTGSTQGKMGATRA